MTVIRIFLFFIIYSFMGWVYESALCSITEKRLVNRGFLAGPVCPVYGVGALVVLFFLGSWGGNVVWLFFWSMILTGIVEYVTAVLLETLFHARWWDYSGCRFHIQGRVCLSGVVVFGLLCVLLVRTIHPAVSALVARVPVWGQIAAGAVFFGALVTDLTFTVQHLLALNGRLQEIQSALNDFIEQQARRAGDLKDSLRDRLAVGLKDALLERFLESEFVSERIQKLLNRGRMQNIRLARAFPRLRLHKYNEAWTALKKLVLNGKNDPRE